MHLATTSARIGTFSGPSHTYGLPVSVIKPPDNILVPVGIVTSGGTSAASAASAGIAMDQSVSDFNALMAQISAATAVR